MYIPPENQTKEELIASYKKLHEEYCDIYHQLKEERKYLHEHRDEIKGWDNLVFAGCCAIAIAVPSVFFLLMNVDLKESLSACIKNPIFIPLAIILGLIVGGINALIAKGLQSELFIDYIYQYGISEKGLKRIPIIITIIFSIIFSTTLF